MDNSESTQDKHQIIEVSERIIQLVSEYAGEDEAKIRATVAATGLVFFRLVREMINDEGQEDFIRIIKLISYRGEFNASERPNTEASSDNGKAGESPEKGPERLP